MRLLIIDDEEIMRVSIRNALADAGHEAIDCERADRGLALLAQERFEVAVVDLKMPGMDGLEFLEGVQRDHGETAVIIMTAYGTVETAVEAMKKGAYDYLTKPFATDELLFILDRLQQQREIVAENLRLRSELQERNAFHQMVGKSEGMQRVYRALEVVCACDCTVLITGETGTGKEMVARAIHFNSSRRNGPLVVVSCAALSTEILESELFGHVRGAFTGAVADKKGRFELADGGTLFLDEVDDIPLELQVKLLRVIENGTFERVGSGETVATDVRLVAASKADLRSRIEEGWFRDDLFYRINQVPIFLPPLRERREDIPLLVDHLLSGRENPPAFSPQAWQLMIGYGWPGNVRELKHIVERLVLFNPGRIEVGDLPEEILSYSAASAAAPEAGMSFEEAIAAYEKKLLLQALEKGDGNQREAARLLDMPASSLRSRLERHGLL